MEKQSNEDSILAEIVRIRNRVRVPLLNIGDLRFRLNSNTENEAGGPRGVGGARTRGSVAEPGFREKMSGSRVHDGSTCTWRIAVSNVPLLLPPKYGQVWGEMEHHPEMFFCSEDEENPCGPCIEAIAAFDKLPCLKYRTLPSGCGLFQARSEMRLNAARKILVGIWEKNKKLEKKKLLFVDMCEEEWKPYFD
jgi:hypothetical protein